MERTWEVRLWTAMLGLFAFLLVVAVLLGAVQAFAQPDQQPAVLVEERRGDVRVIDQKTCTTAGTVELVSAAEAANALSIMVKNTDAANAVYLCETTPCSTSDWPADPKETVVINVSPRSGVIYCDGQTASVVVARWIEYP